MQLKKLSHPVWSDGYGGCLTAELAYVVASRSCDSALLLGDLDYDLACCLEKFDVAIYLVQGVDRLIASPKLLQLLF